MKLATQLAFFRMPPKDAYERRLWNHSLLNRDHFRILKANGTGLSLG